MEDALKALCQRARQIAVNLVDGTAQVQFGKVSDWTVIRACWKYGGEPDHQLYRLVEDREHMYWDCLIIEAALKIGLEPTNLHDNPSDQENVLQFLQQNYFQSSSPHCVRHGKDCHSFCKPGNPCRLLP